MIKIIKLTAILLIFTVVGLSLGISDHASEYHTCEQKNDSNCIIASNKETLKNYNQDKQIKLGQIENKRDEVYNYIKNKNTVDTTKKIDDDDPLTAGNQTVTFTYTQNQRVTPEQAVTDAGITVSGGVEPYFYLASENVDTTVIGNDLTTEVKIIDSSVPEQEITVDVTYNVKNTPLVVDNQTSTPTYMQDEELTPEEVLTDAGVKVSGGVAPYSYSGEIDTTVVADGLETTITVTDGSEPAQQAEVTVTYNVDSAPLDVSDQTDIKTYFEFDEVTAEQLITDSGITVSGGLEPYSYSGEVDTSVIGDGLEAKITIADSSPTVKEAEVDVLYNVERKSLEIGNQTNTPKYSQNQIVTPEELITDAGITVSGGVEPYRYLEEESIDTTVVGDGLQAKIKVEDSSVPEQFEDVDVTYDVEGTPLDVTAQTQTPTYDQNEIVTAEEILTDAGVTVSGGVAPYNYSGEVDTTVIGNEIEAKITVADSLGKESKEVTIVYNVRSPLVVGGQTKTPIYDQNEIVTPEQLVTDAGIKVSGGEEPYKYLGSGNVDTSVIGDEFTTTIKVSDSSDPEQNADMEITYNVESTPLVVEDQTETPEYMQNDVVTPEQLVTDAGVKVSGGVEPYSYSGVVGTKVVGNDFETQITITDSSETIKSEQIVITYNVKGPLVVEAQTKTPLYTQGDVVTPEQLIADAGVKVSGGAEPYIYSGLINTSVVGDGFETIITITDSSTPIQSQDITVKYNIEGPLIITPQTETPTYDQNEVITPQQILTDAGVTVSGGVAPYSYSGEIETTVIGNELETKVVVSDSSEVVKSEEILIKYNIEGPLVVTKQIVTPTYNLAQKVSPKQLVTDAGIEVSGGVEPYKYLGEGDVDTTIVGNSLEANITIEDSSTPPKEEEITIKYNVQEPLVITNQTSIPTYYKGLNTTPDQLIEDSGVTVSGGVAPYNYSGVVDTSVVGNNLESKITVSDNSNPVQSQEITVEYNVEIIPLTVGDQNKIPTYDLNEKVDPEQLIEDAQVSVTGGTLPYNYIGSVDTTKAGNALITDIMIIDSSTPNMIEHARIEYNVTGSPLNVQPQTNIETYDQNEIVTPDQLIEDAGIVVSGGVEPYSYSGTIDTSETGFSFLSEITIEDSENPPQSTTTNVTYNVKVEELSPTPQTKIMTYHQGEEVTPEQFVEDAGITVSGGIAPYTYSGEVNTDAIGNGLNAPIFVEDTSLPPQDLLLDITYNVVE